MPFKMFTVFAASVAFSTGLIPSEANAVDDQNRQPQCIREQMKFDDVIRRTVYFGVPQGVEKISSEVIGDPKFNDGNWSKYEAYFIERVKIGGTANEFMRYRFKMHYMYNRVTKEIAQAKLKHPVVEGCDGERVTSTTPVSFIQVDTGGFEIIVRGHWEWWDRYSNYEYTGSDSWNYVVDSIEIIPRPSKNMMHQ